MPSVRRCHRAVKLPRSRRTGAHATIGPVRLPDIPISTEGPGPLVPGVYGARFEANPINGLSDEHAGGAAAAEAWVKPQRELDLRFLRLQSRAETGTWLILLWSTGIVRFSSDNDAIAAAQRGPNPSSGFDGDTRHSLQQLPTSDSEQYRFSCQVVRQQGGSDSSRTPQSTRDSTTPPSMSLSAEASRVLMIVAWVVLKRASSAVEAARPVDTSPVAAASPIDRVERRVGCVVSTTSPQAMNTSANANGVYLMCAPSYTFCAINPNPNCSPWSVCKQMGDVSMRNFCGFDRGHSYSKRRGRPWV